MAPSCTKSAGMRLTPSSRRATSCPSRRYWWTRVTATPRAWAMSGTDDSSTDSVSRGQDQVRAAPQGQGAAESLDRVGDGDRQRRPPLVGQREVVAVRGDVADPLGGRVRPLPG